MVAGPDDAEDPMSVTAATYLSFPGNAKEAMEFYHDVFGGDLDLLTYGEMRLEGMPFEPPPEAVAHAQLVAEGLRLAGGDDPMCQPGSRSLESSAYSMLLTVETREEGDRLFEALQAGGGTVEMPFEVAPWGDRYGQVKDRFGAIWAIDLPEDGAPQG